MKSAITVICLLIPLVILFVIIDRKDFYSGNDVAVQQETVTRKVPTMTTIKSGEKPAEAKPVETNPVAETKPVETKPVSETKPVETKPTEVKPMETKPVENKKPAETKPVVETKPTTTKPAETRPVAEKKPAETKPTDVKPVESKPVAETKPTEAKPAETKPIAEKRPAETKPVPEEKLAPAAIPVVTAEEAEKLNVFAVFLAGIKTTVVEGEIIERSKLPDPQKSDYPNCRFTVHFNGNSIRSGEPCPKEMSLSVEGFENYRVLPNNDIKTGDKVLCTIIPFDQLPEDFQSTQQTDDLELFLLENYYVVDLKTIKVFSDTNALMPQSGLFFSDENEEYVSIFDRHINPSIPESVKAAQEISIKADLDKMNALLEGYDDNRIKEINSKFTEAWNKEKAKDAPGYNRVGNNVWRNMDNSFWALPSNYTLLSKPKSINKDTLNKFISLKKACEANGVQLIVSLVPNIYVISSRVINPDFRDIPDIQTASCVKQLSEVGIETIYGSDKIIKNYNKFPFAFFYPSNGHPGDTTQDSLSDLLVERIARYNITSDLDPSLFTTKLESSHVYSYPEPYLFPKDCDIGSYKEGDIYVCRHIYYDNKVVVKNNDASIFCFGNSYMQSPMSSPEALPIQIMFKSHSSVNWQYVGANGPFSDILIRLLSNPDFYLQNKKVIIMQVGTDHIIGASNSGIMLDIAQLDAERVLFNNKKWKGHCILSSNVELDKITDSELWGPLSSVEKTVLEINETGTLTFNFKLEQFSNEMSDNKPIICVIPHMCTKNTTCSLSVNNILKPMHCPNYSQNARFFNVVYELPAGTKELSIKVEGKPNQLFSIKDIQLWQ